MLGVNSFITSSIALASPAIFMLIRRPDLIKRALISGILLVFVCMVVYTFLDLLSPGWIDEFFHFQNTPRIILWNLPIDDLVQYFLLGLFAGPIYDYWNGLKLVRKRRLSSSAS